MNSSLEIESRGHSIFTFPKKIFFELKNKEEIKTSKQNKQVIYEKMLIRVALDLIDQR